MLRYSNTNNMTDNITDNITDNNTSKNMINSNALSNMTNNLLTLFCLVDGEWNPFSVEVDRTKTVDTLKDAIKDKNAIAFADVNAKILTLWSVSIPVSDDDDDDEVPIYINNIRIEKFWANIEDYRSKKELFINWDKHRIYVSVPRLNATNISHNSPSHERTKSECLSTILVGYGLQREKCKPLLCICFVEEKIENLEFYNM